MKQINYLLIYLSMILGITLSATADTSWKTERFGLIQTFQRSAEPKAVVIFFADDGADASSIRDTFLDQGLLVVQVRPKEYLKRVTKDGGTCSYLAGEITRLNQSAQSSLKVQSFTLPFIAGTGSGTALAQKVVHQFPKDYRGLITFPSCLNCQIKRTLCSDSKDSLPPILEIPSDAFRSSKKLPSWRDQVSQFLSNTIFQAEPAIVIEEGALQEIPVVEIPSSNITKDTLGIMISGDGGWADIDATLSKFLGNRGYPVVGLDALRFFWNKKTPEETAQAISTMIGFYGKKYHTKKTLLIGYSLGADVMPFIANRLPKPQKDALAGIVLLNPGPLVAFEMHISDWLGIENNEGAVPIEPELKKITYTPLVCIYGETEAPTGCQSLFKSPTTKKLPGDHHFNGDYETLGKTFLSLAGLPDQ